MKDDRSKTLSSGHFHNHIIGTPNFSFRVVCKKLQGKTLQLFCRSEGLHIGALFKDYRTETISKGFAIDTIFKGVRIDTIFKGLTI